ncbi:MAG TPA: NAD(P)-dependent oxidoreductase [Pseudolysinimonas sp.]|nr:NAD(P)-dependent oxidoreductase [Pseudolysinimonas sp.]
MRIFLAGGSGVIGLRLIPVLRLLGHDVIASTRHPAKLESMVTLGAEGVIADVYDTTRLAQTLDHSGADLVMHQLTDLSARDFDANARIRREGTAHLVAATRAAGIDRMIAQSIAWVFPDGGAPATEEDAIEPGTAVDDMERQVRELPHATVLRYGMLYGPGTWYPDASALPGDTPETSPFVHIDDVVTATVKAINWPDGTYHLVGNEPPIAGRAISNAKARAAGWVPEHPTWRGDAEAASSAS